MNAYTIFFLGLMIVGCVCIGYVGFEMTSHLDNLLLTVIDCILIVILGFGVIIFLLLAVGSFIEDW